jgi:hypothetical protein
MVVASLLDHSFIGKGRVLRLTARISDGWNRYKYSYGFSEQRFIDWKCDHRLRTQLSIFPSPGGLTDGFRSPPEFEILHNEVPGIKFMLSSGVLTIDLELLMKGVKETSPLPDGDIINMLLPWRRTSNNKAMIDYVDNEFADCRLRLQIVLQPPPVQHPVYVDWNRRFFPGGLPSLGKRR